MIIQHRVASWADTGDSPCESPGAVGRPLDDL